LGFQNVSEPKTRTRQNRKGSKGFQSFCTRVEPGFYSQNSRKVLDFMTETAYVEYKDTKDLLMQFSLPFGSKNVLVFVWRSVKGLKRNTNFKGDYVGAYVANPSRRKSGLFGEIHLVNNRIGAGYVAHELQHLLYDWLLEQTITRNTNERLALLAGNITREFWTTYYNKKGKD
jgi:hypothetical protein